MPQANPLFDRCFDIAQDESQEARYSEEDLAATRQAAFEEGRQSGIAEMAQKSEAEVSRQLIEQLATLSTQDDERRREIAQDCGQVLQAICTRMVPRLVEEGPLTEIFGIVQDCLATQPNEPRIVVRVAHDISEAVQQRLSELSGQSGYNGELILVPDDALSRNDCSVLWADGGAERRCDEIWSQIEELLSRTLGAGNSTEPEPIDQPAIP